MTDDARGTDLETEDGEVLPAREVMSIITTDPTDAFVVEPGPVIEPGPPPPGDEMSIQPVEDERDVHRTDPIDPPTPAA